MYVCWNSCTDITMDVWHCDSCSFDLVRVARLQNEVGAKYIFRATKFLTKNAPKLSRKFRAFSLWVHQKFPQKFYQISRKISLPKFKNCPRRGRNWVWANFSLFSPIRWPCYAYLSGCPEFWPVQRFTSYKHILKQTICTFLNCSVGGLSVSFWSEYVVPPLQCSYASSVCLDPERERA